jgi:uncharacterized membrane protein YgcG
MNMRIDLRGLLVAVITAVSCLAFSAPAFAGTLQLRDDGHVLGAADAAKLRSVAADVPFDSRLVFTSDYADSQDLGRFVGSLVDESNMIVVGIDTQHRHVQVHFGRGAGIARSEWSAVETAGNAEFHSGQWADGVAAILRTAARHATATPSGSASPGGLPSPGSLLMILLLVGGGIAVIALVVRRFTSRPGGVVYGYGGPDYRGPGYPGAYGPGAYGPSGGIGPLGAGAIGAGLGGLAGYELGKLEGEREQRGGLDDRAAPEPADENFDAGGGGSSWDDGGGGGGDSGGGNDGGGSDF